MFWFPDGCSFQPPGQSSTVTRTQWPPNTSSSSPVEVLCSQRNGHSRVRVSRPPATRDVSGKSWRGWRPCDKMRSSWREGLLEGTLSAVLKPRGPHGVPGHKSPSVSPVSCLWGIGFIQPRGPSLGSKRQISAAVNQGRVGMRRLGRGSAETAEHPWGRVLPRP